MVVWSERPAIIYTNIIPEAFFLVVPQSIHHAPTMVWLCTSTSKQLNNNVLSRILNVNLYFFFSSTPIFLVDSWIAYSKVFDIFSLLMASYLWYYIGLRYSVQDFTVVKLVLIFQIMIQKSEDNTCMFLVRINQWSILGFCQSLKASVISH